jgi:thiamine biosynthesis protein ThiS
MPATQIEITINGKIHRVDSGSTIEQLIHNLQMVPQQVAVEVNQQLISRKDHADHQVCTGDQLEIVSLAGGG